MEKLAHSARSDKAVDLSDYTAVVAQLRSQGASETTICNVAEHLTLPTYEPTPNHAAVLIACAGDRRFAIGDWLKNGQGDTMLLVTAETAAGFDWPILLARRAGDVAVVTSWRLPPDMLDFLGSMREGFRQWPEGLLRGISHMLAKRPDRAFEQGFERQ
jgi:hypothetical protein